MKEQGAKPDSTLIGEGDGIRPAGEAAARASNTKAKAGDAIPTAKSNSQPVIQPADQLKALVSPAAVKSP